MRYPELSESIRNRVQQYSTPGKLFLSSVIQRLPLFQLIEPAEFDFLLYQFETRIYEEGTLLFF